MQNLDQTKNGNYCKLKQILFLLNIITLKNTIMFAQDDCCSQSVCF